nr:response regulator [Gemmatimonadales bacterium]
MTDASHRGRLRALVVEDDATLGTQVTQVLTSLGHQVVGHVLTGRAGLDILDAPGAAVDVVLIDHHLPDAGGGLDLLDAIHA